MDIMEALVDIMAKWKCLGMALRIKQADLEAISSKHVSDAKENLRDTLNAWLQHRYNVEQFGQPSWKLLCQAVHNRVGGDNPKLAKTIAEKHRSVLGRKY